MAEKYANTQAQANFQDVIDLTSSLYGMKVLTVKRLDGYEDQNFHIMVDMNVKENDNVSKLHEHGYIFRIINSLDSQEEQDHIFAQIKLLKHLGSKGFVCPQIVPTKIGEFFAEHHLPKKDQTGTRMHLIQMAEYIAGEIVGAGTISVDIAFKGGVCLAKLHNTMEGFDDRRLHRNDYIWSLSNVYQLRPYIDLVEDERRRTVVTEVMDKWDSLQQVFSKLSEGPIHADFNEQNILVKMSGEETVIAGIIDFQDSGYGYLVYDVGIYMMYMMCFCEEDPIKVAGYCLRGFIDNYKLSEIELDIVYYCVAARLVQSLLLGLHFYSVRKDPYLLTTQKGGWKVLEKLWKLPSKEVLKYWLSDKS